MFDFIEGAWNSATSVVSNAGGTVIDTVGGGAVQVWRDTQGGIQYAVDWTKTTADQTGAWVQSVAGDSADFTIDSYNKARAEIVPRWQQILALAMGGPPELGPPNDLARNCMKAVLGAGMSSVVIDAWAVDAANKGYTLAFGFRGTLTAGANGTAYSGIYVDNQGNWGFFAGIGAGLSPIPSLDAAIGVEAWMIFSGRDAYSKKYFMPGFQLNVPRPVAGAFTGGANVLIGNDFGFKGFRIHSNFSLYRSDSLIAPDAGPAQTNLVVRGLSKQGPNYDAAARVARDPNAEANIVATAMASILIPASQDQWRWCSRCMSLFYGGHTGVCPHGGPHNPQGSGNYTLYAQAPPRGVPGGVSRTSGAGVTSAAACTTFSICPASARPTASPTPPRAQAPTSSTSTSPSAPTSRPTGAGARAARACGTARGAAAAQPAAPTARRAAATTCSTFPERAASPRAAASIGGRVRVTMISHAAATRCVTPSTEFFDGAGLRPTAFAADI